MSHTSRSQKNFVLLNKKGEKLNKLRFIMIKYSQRGLVVNGKLPFLFYLQYLLISVAFYCQWSLILAYFAFFYSESLDENMLKTFRFRGGGEVNCFFRAKYFATLTCIFSMLFLDILLWTYFTPKWNRKNIIVKMFSLFI